MDTAVEAAPEGFEVFQFTADNCEVTVSAQVESDDPANKFYHVSLDDSAIGFCWTAVVDERGEIISTGSEAVNAPGLGNPAAIYCTEQGFRYEITTADDGSQCGQCFFSDAPDDACDAWDFFHGRCAPAEQN
jgi:putative hemolysin